MWKYTWPVDLLPLLKIVCPVIKELIISKHHWLYWLYVNWEVYLEITFFSDLFFLPSCLCNWSFQNSIKVSLQVLLSIHMHKVELCVNHMCLSLFLMILPFASAAPIYLSITTWSSMMLMACTPTLLKQSGRFVTKFDMHSSCQTAS